MKIKSTLKSGRHKFQQGKNEHCTQKSLLKCLAACWTCMISVLNTYMEHHNCFRAKNTENITAMGSDEQI